MKSNAAEEVFKESGRGYFIVASGGAKKREAVFNRFPVIVKYEVGLPAEWH